MVFIRTGKSLRSGRLVVLIFTFLLSLSLFAQNPEVDLAEEPRISVEVSPDKIIVGQRFDFTIFADFPTYRNVSISEPQLPDGLVLVGGPYKSAQTINVGDNDNPQYIKKTRVFYKFKVSRPGFYTIESFTLGDGREKLKTESVMFPALAFDERELKYPISARWNTIPDQVFMGETIPLILEMENLEELAFPERISMSPPSGGVFEQVDSLGDIAVTVIEEDEVYLVPVDSWMYTPTSLGTLKIPSAEVSFNGIKRSTDSTFIKVVNLPSQVGLSGAIGNFQVSTEMETPVEQKGGILTMKIRVDGEGNLNFLRMPQPEFSGFTVIEKEELYNIYPSLSGYKGYREDVYRISLGEDDVNSVQFSPWSWFNRDSDSVLVEKLTGYSFQNEMTRNLSEDKSLRDEFPLLTPEQILRYKAPFYNIGWYYLLVLPGIVSAIVAMIKRRFDMKVIGYSLLLLILTSSAVSDNPQLKEKLERAKDIFISVGPEKTIEYYGAIIDEFGENAGIFHNLALLSYDLEKKDDVIYFLRKSLIKKPGSRLFISLLSEVELEYNLDHQAAASTGFYPDLYFLLFILFFNLGALVISFNISRKKIELSILIVMLFFSSSISLILVYYTDFVSHRETGVIVQGGGDLKKVPGLMGGSWLTLQEGSAVYIKSESDESYLIRTGYGLEGWLHKDSLKLVQDNSL